MSSEKSGKYRAIWILLILVAVILVALGAGVFGYASLKHESVAVTSIETPSDSDAPPQFAWPSPTSAADPATPANQVLTFNCETQVSKPDAILFACADGYEGIEKISWSTWSVTGAIGTGTYFRNQCDPDCASGKFAYQKVSLALGGAIATEGKVFLTLLDYGGVGASLAPESGTDISEFYRAMKSQ
ncbi:MAG: hypothetical protein F2843_01755 [Actinobacteria bacterium]|uniref:Unannotated protein n=1 Tax=freshwater metagenome TaxID=449393 RepID=A0A6J7IY59_9ZZZZ|nr:hypothetical protein [Actinomycetota bacterium]